MSGSDGPAGPDIADRPTQAPAGPPAGTVFSLDQRPAPGLYLVAWLLSVVGLGLAVVGLFGQALVLSALGLITLGAGLAAGAGYQLVARSRRPAAAYRGPAPLLLFALVIVFVSLLGALIALLSGARRLPVDRPDVFLVGLLIQVVGYIVLIALFVVGPRVLSWHEIANLQDGRIRDHVGGVLFAVGLMVPMTLLALLIGGLLSQLLDVRPESVLPMPQSQLDVALLVLAAVVLAPIGEEVFYRGFALTAWLRDLGERRALIRSAVFFALVHVLNLQAEPGQLADVAKQAVIVSAVILPVGVVLGWLFLRHGLLAAIVAHATYNGIAVLLQLLREDLLPPS
ncbi:MAG: CPBP family intramembrane metalloprotease [Chloroflexota bacterium]|nr:CPBP family intramembrane metalloprotease [Chloroflexota bacterium]